MRGNRAEARESAGDGRQERTRAGRRVRRFGVAVLALAAAFAAQASAAHAANYVYEKVSPAYKGNGEVSGGALIMGFRSDLLGDRVVYGSDGLFAGVPFTTGFNAYFATRGAQEWITTSPAAALPYELPADFFVNPLLPGNVTPPGVSRDGTRAIVESNIDPDSGDLVYSRMYMFDLEDQSYVRLSPEVLAGSQMVTVSPQDGGVAGTDDFGVVYFSSTAQLTPEALAPGVSASLEKLYRYDGAGIELASHLPAGGPSGGVPVGARDTPVGRNSVSGDGGVFWFYPTRSGTQVPLYRGEAGAAESVLINESESSGPPLTPGRAVFKGATPDGGRAVFTSGQVLVDGASANDNVYLYTHSAEPGSDQNLTLISADGEPADGGAVAVDQVAGVSEDAKTVYFTTTGNQLVPGGPTGPGWKLYRWHDGELSYLAPARIFGSGPELLSSAASADGRYLMFTSPSTGITSDDTNGLAQQYLFDAETGGIACTSCRAGAPSTAAVNTGVSLNVLQLGSAPRRWLLDDGRVFFQTAESLLPRDTNGKRDVYTWKAGQLDLISTGRSTDDARFGDSSADGSTVFFATRERISGWDTDNAVDLYAARIGGGLPEPAARPQETCTGDDCQPPPSPRPADPLKGSATLQGQGNSSSARDCSGAQRQVSALRRQGRSLERRVRALRRAAKRHRRAGNARRGALRSRQAIKIARRDRRIERRLAAARGRLQACRSGA